jgi:glutamate carboxypeptidase
MLVLGFEPSLPDGSIIESRRGNRWYLIRVKGKEAHAGRAHQDGINACHELAIQLDRLQRLTDYSRNVTVSIGHMTGGQDKYNIVCGSAEAKIDARFADFKNFEKLQRSIEKTLRTSYVKSFSTHEPSLISFEVITESPPLPLTPKSKHYADIYRKIVEKIEGRPIHSSASGGTADVNYLSDATSQTPILDGFGPVGGDLHTENEYIDLESLETRSKSFAQFLASVMN